MTARTRLGTLDVVDFLLTTCHAMKPIILLAPVALTEDVPEHGLTRGQIGTVVEHLEREGEHALMVEFSDEQGQTHALVGLQPHQLMVLHRGTEAA